MKLTTYKDPYGPNITEVGVNCLLNDIADLGFGVMVAGGSARDKVIINRHPATPSYDLFRDIDIQVFGGDEANKESLFKMLQDKYGAKPRGYDYDHLINNVKVFKIGDFRKMDVIFYKDCSSMEEVIDKFDSNINKYMLNLKGDPVYVGKPEDNPELRKVLVLYHKDLPDVRVYRLKEVFNHFKL